ncbi:MAG: GNAT family N-acetyltransferase [Rubrobacteraceae bacterium]|nr:GNAT family N-acetyltransferase [Rubrobacteraceae bacterium]
MLPPILRDFPDSFETPRLLVRSPMPGDGAELHAAVRESYRELEPWMPWVREHETVEGSEESVRRARVRFLERSDLRLHLFLKGTGTLVGASGLHRIDWSVPKFEIGYWCRSRFAGQGYITEAVRGITAFAFEHLGARRVEVRCDPRNERSERVIRRCGFKLEGTLRHAQVAPDGSLRDTLVFSLLPGEYETW